MLDAKVVGSVLQRLREERGLPQEIVSGLAGIGRTHLSAIERGERKPTLETFYRIGEVILYRYDLDEINHNPYELAAYLTVKFEDYTRDDGHSEG